MDQETFTKLAAVAQHWHGQASDWAAVVIGPLLLAGALGGLWLTAWIFRGGLSQPDGRTRGRRGCARHS
jgi:hypothetical protein